MKAKITEQVAQVIKHYPPQAKSVFNHVRKIVISAAKESGGLANTTETLKWGEPSYLTDGGSTVRMKWTEKEPDQFSLYFNCHSILVETFKELYQDEFTFDGNRAISFPLKGKLPNAALKHCISMSMQYHKLKKLPLLGN